MNSRNFKIAVLASMLALILAVPAVAQEEIDVTRDLSSDGRLSIENIAGSVIVSGWDKDEVHITGTLGKGTERLDVDGNRNRLKIEVILPRRARNVKGSHLHINMPYGAELKVSTVSADIEVKDLRGELSLESVSGEIEVEADPAGFEAESVSGDLELIVGGEVLELATVSGDIVLKTQTPRELEIGTISGDVEVLSKWVKRIDFESISGDLDFAGEIRERGSFNSQSGDLYILFSGDPDAEFEIGTFSGDIRNAFGPEPRKSNKFNLGKTLEFTAGDGRANIDIESFSGDIIIKTR